LDRLRPALLRGPLELLRDLPQRRARAAHRLRVPAAAARVPRHRRLLTRVCLLPAGHALPVVLRPDDHGRPPGLSPDLPGRQAAAMSAPGNPITRTRPAAPP